LIGVRENLSLEVLWIQQAIQSRIQVFWFQTNEKIFDWKIDLYFKYLSIWNWRGICRIKSG
jgi:hypothetical protein